MPRVNHVKKARKKNPAVKKGKSYYWWKFRYGGKRYSATYPRPSQLTQSKWGMILEAQEAIEDAKTIDDLRSEIESAADTIREAGSEYEEAAEHFGGEGDNRERADACEMLVDELDGLVSECDEDIDCGACAGSGNDSDEDDGNCPECEGNGNRPADEAPEDEQQDRLEEIKSNLEGFGWSNPC